MMDSKFSLKMFRH